jgi:hypothetical protein
MNRYKQITLKVDLMMFLTTISMKCLYEHYSININDNNIKEANAIIDIVTYTNQSLINLTNN